LQRAALALVVLAVVWFAARHPSSAPPLQAPPGPHPGPVHEAFTQAASGTLVHVSGRVQRVLAEDREGLEHQRFIIATDGGTTLLVAHNIDLAPRLDGLAAGDTVEVYGEYQWNDRGGVIHWTHRDPSGRHTPGYIEWRGRRYQ
jgi:hypothetical protein